MTEHPRPEPTDSRRVAVTVTRTGGIAGMRRTWRAHADDADAERWVVLIDQCPWDAADPARPLTPNGADRFVWRLEAVCGPSERAAALPDTEVQGPWRELIDAVRAAGRSPATDRRGPSSS